MLPLDLKDNAWFDNKALQTLKKVNKLIRPKHFMTALILGINALIAIITSLTVSSTTLVSEIKAKHFLNDLNKNISLTLVRQQIIDKKLKTKLYALEDVVLKLRQEIKNIKVQLSTKCHDSFRYIYVMPLSYDKNHKLKIIC